MNVNSDEHVPLSPRALAERASQFTFNRNIPLRNWLRTGTTLLKQACIYIREKDFENGLFLLYRYAELFFHCQTHPEASQYKKELHEFYDTVNTALEEITLLKPLVQESYDKQVELLKRQKIEDENLNKFLVSKNHDVDKIPQQTNHSISRTHSSWTVDDLKLYPASSTKSNDETHKAHSHTLDFSYPSATTTSSVQNSAAGIPISAPRPIPNVPTSQTNGPPPLPNKPLNKLTSQFLHFSPPSEVPEKQTKSFKIQCYTEGGKPLRTVFLPSSIRSTFLRIAKPNTDRRLETCGILCGKLRQNAFFITKLVIPPQEATTDTCSTTDEAGLFEYQDKHDLLTLGWIHTHPTQTCFMSSVDLHTHCSYQLMLPEAIAIVLAPSKKLSSGIFRLLDPTGLQTVVQCRKPGLFHPHEGRIYTSAEPPGHVRELDAPLEVVDLR
ncbi:AMSH protein [Schizosaccharomyces japonicus yFS275]|uniref:AMSH protein n=1 Tax=Schizosaccharomyces japonicus (strain yFS275 / FY16936) TaxID=402676 RepID=B6K089_SCHJY|nr:AMSH protein [Schizosaccharomyces japonicus yFS275]EEB06239.2 AMSH protein [Schizosaccharomyces japonicus yFS275]